VNAWGMFAYPGNQTNNSQHVVTDCFAFGRSYGSRFTPRHLAMTFPYSVQTLSVLGGRCNNVSLPCYDMPVKNNRRYILPGQISLKLEPFPGQYSIVQFYRLVVESRTADWGVTWDCRSPDPRDHWTTAPEVYCWTDFVAAVRGRSPYARVTHPAAVALAWNRLPGAS
jgi:hypothetical protein